MMPFCVSVFILTPPTKSQKNLRKNKPQNPAQMPSVVARKGWVSGQGVASCDTKLLTDAGKDGNKASPFVPDENAHVYLEVVESVEKG